MTYYLDCVKALGFQTLSMAHDKGAKSCLPNIIKLDDLQGYTGSSNGAFSAHDPLVNSPVVIDACAPDSKMIDGSIVGRGVLSCCYCVLES